MYILLSVILSNPLDFCFDLSSTLLGFIIIVIFLLLFFEGFLLFLHWGQRCIIPRDLCVPQAFRHTAALSKTVPSHRKDSFLQLILHYDTIDKK